MCRLFGFRSRIPSRVHAALVSEQNSLRVQSREHGDGWGIVAYADTALPPDVAHGLGPAHSDPEFDRVSGMLSAQTVLAHIRLASVGKVTRENAHPFVYGRWSFAHNGTVREFVRHQATLEALIAPEFVPLLQGETDSERCFLLFLTQMRKQGSLERAATIEEVGQALSVVTRQVALATDSEEKPSSLNFLVTDGELLLACRRQRTLFFSEQKHKYLPHVEPQEGTDLQQIVIASEKLTPETHWHEVPDGHMVGVDRSLRLFRAPTSAWDIRGA